MVEAKVTVTTNQGSTSPFDYAASMVLNTAVAATPVFSESGAVLNAAGPTLNAGNGDYSWSAFDGSVSLGTLAPGASETVDYDMTSNAFGTVAGSGNLAVSAIAVYGGYGGYGGTGGSSVARIGDPNSIAGGNGPFSITSAQSVPEPASAMVFGAGLAGLASLRKRRRAG